MHRAWFSRHPMRDWSVSVSSAGRPPMGFYTCVPDLLGRAHHLERGLLNVRLSQLPLRRHGSLADRSGRKLLHRRPPPCEPSSPRRTACSGFQDPPPPSCLCAFGRNTHSRRVARCRIVTDMARPRPPIDTCLKCPILFARHYRRLLPIGKCLRCSLRVSPPRSHIHPTPRRLFGRGYDAALRARSARYTLQRTGR